MAFNGRIGHVEEDGTILVITDDDRVRKANLDDVTEINEDHEVTVNNDHVYVTDEGDE